MNLDYLWLFSYLSPNPFTFEICPFFDFFAGFCGRGSSIVRSARQTTRIDPVTGVESFRKKSFPGVEAQQGEQGELLGGRFDRSPSRITDVVHRSMTSEKTAIVGGRPSL